MTSAAASLGAIFLWNVELGLTEIDKYLYIEDDNIKVNYFVIVIVIYCYCYCYLLLLLFVITIYCYCYLFIFVYFINIVYF